MGRYEFGTVRRALQQLRPDCNIVKRKVVSSPARVLVHAVLVRGDGVGYTHLVWSYDQRKLGQQAAPVMKQVA